MDDLRTRKPSNVRALRTATDFANGVGSLGVDHPLRAAQRRQDGREGGGVGEVREVAEGRDPAGALGGFEPVEEESSEQAGEDPHVHIVVPGLHAIQRDPSGARPPPGTTT